MESAGKSSGTLRVGMGAMISQYVIMPRLPRYLQQHPNLFVECRLLKQPQDMLAEGVDLLLRGGGCSSAAKRRSPPASMRCS